MGPLRTFFQAHGRMALAFALAALAMKALLPAGFMLSMHGDRVLTVTICADASGTPKQMQIALPTRGDLPGDPSKKAEAGKPCPFSGLGHGALGGADLRLLAGALAFILLLGLAQPQAPPRRAAAFLRPPLRGPPSLRN